MKKFLFLIALVFLCNCLFAQDTVRIRKHKNSICLELGYSNNGAAIIYDKIFLKRNSIALSAGTGIAFNWALWEYHDFYPPISINMLIGKKRHYFLLGNNLSIDEYKDDGPVERHYYYNGILGYRFIPLKKGLFFKLNLAANIVNYNKTKYYNNTSSSSTYYFINHRSLRPGPGFDLGIGYTF
jgi:hypothetical protein